MANNYVTSSTVIEIQKHLPEIEAACVEAVSKVEQALPDTPLGFDYESGEGEVWLYSDGDFNPETASMFVELIVERLNVEKPTIVSWSYTCSKLRPDNFGGGAFMVRRGTQTEFIDAYQHMLDIVDN